MPRDVRRHRCAWCGQPLKRYAPSHDENGFRLCLSHSSSDELRCGDVLLSPRFAEHLRNPPRPATVDVNQE